MPPGQPDPMQSMASPMGESPPMDDQAGYTVCIECKPDGTFMVGLDEPEMPGPDGQPPAASGMQPARDVKDALTIALGLIKSGGKQAQAQQDFATGYNEMGDR